MKTDVKYRVIVEYKEDDLEMIEDCGDFERYEEAESYIINADKIMGVYSIDKVWIKSKELK